MTSRFRKSVNIAPVIRQNSEDKLTTSAKRRYTELKKMQHQYEKMHERQKAKYEVEMYEQYINMICSIHKECEDFIDWNAIQLLAAPYEKGEKGPRELEAEHRLMNFKPKLLDKLLGRVDKRHEQLTLLIQEAKLADEQSYSSWEKKVGVAKNINNGDPNAYLQIIEELNIFEAIQEYGSQFHCDINKNANIIVVKFNVNAKTIVPTHAKSLTTTGKLSIQEMTKTKFYAIYQDYVCSCVIRIARDIFAILPVNQVIIHAMDEQLNPSTGHIEQQTILSVRFDRTVLNALNVEKIDCSDAIRNFEHHMKFMKTSGFRVVQQISE